MSAARECKDYDKNLVAIYQIGYVNGFKRSYRFRLKDQDVELGDLVFALVLTYRGVVYDLLTGKTQNLKGFLQEQLVPQYTPTEYNPTQPSTITRALSWCCGCCRANLSYAVEHCDAENHLRATRFEPYRGTLMSMDALMSNLRATNKPYQGAPTTLDLPSSDKKCD